MCNERGAQFFVFAALAVSCVAVASGPEVAPGDVAVRIDHAWVAQLAAAPVLEINGEERWMRIELRVPHWWFDTNRELFTVGRHDLELRYGIADHNDRPMVWGYQNSGIMLTDKYRAPAGPVVVHFLAEWRPPPQGDEPVWIVSP